MGSKQFCAPNDAILIVVKGADNDPRPERGVLTGFEYLSDDKFGGRWRKLPDLDVDRPTVHARTVGHRDGVYGGRWPRSEIKQSKLVNKMD